MSNDFDQNLDRYINGDYLSKNPDWDVADSPWKAKNVVKILNSNKLKPKSVVEVGCGAGAVLAELEKSIHEARFFGYDIAPDASVFWERYKSTKVSFELGDFLQLNKQKYDILLLLDVIEHVADPISFLVSLREHADYFVFHIPLDLSAVNVIREKPLLFVRNKVGHIHYFTKGLALTLLEECGYSIVEWTYSGASTSSPQKTFKRRLANIPRYLISKINKDLSVRILGGETLLVLAKTGSN